MFVCVPCAVAHRELQASDAGEQLDEVTDSLLLAMHDLRSVLVRKKADALMAKDKRDKS